MGNGKIFVREKMSDDTGNVNLNNGENFLTDRDIKSVSLHERKKNIIKSRCIVRGGKG